MKTFFTQKIAIDYEPGKHITQLDGVRGFAIFLVLLFHCFPFIAPARLGWLGVDLFFVLSGFLITGILWDTKSHEDYYKNFLVRRMVRIFPLYYAFLIIFFFVLPLFSTLDIEGFQSVQTWYWLYVTNWLFVFELQDWIKGIDINHFWSLAIEEQFYLFWPFVVYFFSKRGIMNVIISLVLLSIVSRVYFYVSGYEPISNYVSTITRVDGLALGGAVALGLRTPKWKEFIETHVLRFFFIALVSILFTVGITRSTSPYSVQFITLGYTFNSLFFLSLLLLTLSSYGGGWFRKVADSQFLRFLGKYSYALYVFHLPLYSYFDHRWYSYFMDIANHHFVSRLMSASSVIFVTIVLSLISWRVLEKPFLRVKNYFLY